MAVLEVGHCGILSTFPTTRAILLLKLYIMGLCVSGEPHHTCYSQRLSLASIKIEVKIMLLLFLVRHDACLVCKFKLHVEGGFEIINWGLAYEQTAS